MVIIILNVTNIISFDVKGEKTHIVKSHCQKTQPVHTAKKLEGNEAYDYKQIYKNGTINNQRNLESGVGAGLPPSNYVKCILTSH